ncbi:GNAT family N-acetyltransferase [Myxococcus sp. RHSTA-1-4]|uniref:GNAT family N-acetyltransferase n=1 Tax=Myxococcus sp. RHSTA-1-4 TaxID=2874601 RepID=UPI001CBABBBD|nr:GNAT family N-acetyltransferase [Myxococcus sp. RHSTA-1-4]MBZ4419505.1 GNAT family N-acetyltransferase [Myxococcus sp. RHSTA-1-4]
MKVEVLEVRSDAEAAACFRVMHQLRPHLDEATFLTMWRRMSTGGYQLTCVREDGQVRAVAGWRLIEMLHTGLHLYVDDLVTDGELRSRGHGARLLGWLRERAREAGCRTLELDSGTHRTRAHRFYFREGMHISSFHFREELG